MEDATIIMNDIDKGFAEYFECADFPCDAF